MTHSFDELLAAYRGAVRITEKATSRRDWDALVIHEAAESEALSRIKAYVEKLERSLLLPGVCCAYKPVPRILCKLDLGHDGPHDWGVDDKQKLEAELKVAREAIRNVDKNNSQR